MHLGKGRPSVFQLLKVSGGLAPFLPVKAGKSLEVGLAVVTNHTDNSLVTVWSDAYLTGETFLCGRVGPASFHPEFNCIWKSKCSPTMNTFLWRICIGKLPVRALLSRWSNIPGDCSCCPGSLETIDHALFACPHATEVWNIICSKWNNLLWPRTVEYFLHAVFTSPRQGYYQAWLLISASVLLAGCNANTFDEASKPARITAYLAIAAAEELYFFELCGRAARRSILDLPQRVGVVPGPLLPMVH